MAKETDEIAKLKDEKEDLAREVIEQKLKGINGQLQAMGDTIHQRITDVEEKSSMEFTHLRDGINQVLTITQETFKQAKETNGRVTEIEIQRMLELDRKKIEDEEHADVKKHTRVVRFMHKYPLVTTGFVLVGYLFSISEIRSFTIDGIGKFFAFFGKIF